MRRLLPALCLLLAACAELPVSVAVPEPAAESATVSPAAARQFVEVARAVEPVAERECRARTTGMNCDFQIVVDDRPNQPPNAFQTEDNRGRPILAFNYGLIEAVRNADELAFVMGHEASHHILAHLAQTRQSAMVGAVVFSGIAAISGASPDEIRTAEQYGAAAGARAYSKGFELEADQLGTIIAARAGFDPVRGAAFFTRLPDPGNRFLGSHPPNAERIRIVKQTAAGL